MYSLFVLILLTGAEAAGQSRIAVEVEETTKGFSFLVYITTDKSICTGAIIGATWVITTAQCIKATSITIRAGNVNRPSNGTLHTCFIIMIHPQYIIGSYEYNYGLCLVWPRFPLGTPGYSLVKIPWHPPPTDTTSWISGWGCAAHDGRMTTIMKPVTMSVISSEICQGYYQEVIISPTIHCAKATEGNLCAYGDWADPLIGQATGELYGMAIFTTNYTNSPAGFTNIAKERYWIYGAAGL